MSARWSKRLDFAARLLGGHVLRRAHDAARHRAAEFRLGSAGGRDETAREVGRGRVLFRDDFRETPVHDEHAAEVAEHDVFRLEIAVDDALAVGEGDGIADLLEDGEERGQRIFFHRLGDAIGEEFEHLFQGDAAHEFHRVEKLVLLIDAEFVDGDDVRMIELRGDLRLLDEAQHIGLVAAAEHHLHGDGALGGVLPRIEDRAHAAAGDDAADGVALFRKQLIGQKAPDGRLRRGEADAGLGGRAPAVDFECHVAEADGLVGEKAGGFGDGLPVDEGAVAAAEVFEQELIVVDRELRVPPRDERGAGVEIDAGFATDDVLAGRKRGPRQFHVLVAQDDLGLGDMHGTGECASAPAKPSREMPGYFAGWRIGSPR
jgi:hypothetical protein